MKMKKGTMMVTAVIAILLVAALVLAYLAFFKAPTGILNDKQASDSISNIGSSIEDIASTLTSIDGLLGR